MKGKRPRADDLTRRLARDLTRRRFAHSLAAARLARALAPAAGVDPTRAFIAALLHDCARDLNPAQSAKLLRTYRGRYRDATILAAPRLWHNPVGVVLARRRYGVNDPGILRAIARHTLGGPGMRPLDKLVYLTDAAEPGRTQPEARRTRDLARRDLDAAFRLAVAGKLDYLLRQGLRPHPRTLAMVRELELPKKRSV